MELSFLFWLILCPLLLCLLLLFTVLVLISHCTVQDSCCKKGQLAYKTLLWEKAEGTLNVAKYIPFYSSFVFILVL